ncbi:MAG TPA: hypothetical protein VH085_01755 [Nocardioides sp.]|jgi:hypothetical protein|nr:hypothetical protein [Nocardioides sp.]
MTDVGDQPTPEIEPAEPPPGGVDAIERVEYEVDAVVPDLGGVGNSTAKDQLPDAVTEPNDTGDGATTDGASEPEKESPA